MQAWGYPLLALAGGLWLAAGAHAAGPVELERAENKMGTLVTITVWAQDRTACAQALDAGFAEVTRIERKFSVYRQGSAVSEINQYASRRPVAVDDEVIRLLQWARRISEATDGAFDITVGAYTWEYGFGQATQHVPPFPRLEQLKRVVNYRYVVVIPEDRTVLLKRDGVQIDLGGIAKSYALNRVRAVLRASGVQAALVNAGGDVTVIGSKPGGGPWLVGVRHPRNPGHLLTVIPIRAGKVLSSGDYERFFLHEGKRYSHILDPRSGQPVSFSMAATLFLPERPKLDLPSVALMLLPPEKALRLVESIPGADCLIVDAGGKIWLTPRWQKKLKITW